MPNSDRYVFEVFYKAIAHSSTTAIALFLKFSTRRSLTLGQQAIALFLRFSVRRSHLINYQSIKLKHDYS
ncbi:hypothetical protein H6G97_18645 [Nostoc flagelliforme FACHB-838]|uniref:Transposase n=1 Tax=Nostoc flagelliforme FACHB-838 TaxID=2692904 RepID=A0ABR8DTF3_9NOSO|nr:hypothetical protein [Nostoc flagelliforme]MBD2531495.1 hypothetical protein [Nostoc flagelliforme FACHB-838]